MDPKMDIDWEVEIGGGAPVIEADWPGFIDLRAHPERISDILEASSFPPLADLLIGLNSSTSPVWTSKCDVWQLQSGGLACYVDLIPQDGNVFGEWRHIEGFCRTLVEQIIAKTHKESKSGASTTLVVRQAIAGHAEGYGVTAYFSAEGESVPFETEIAGMLGAFSNAIQSIAFLQAREQS
jgi:hypothetical protein